MARTAEYPDFVQKYLNESGVYVKKNTNGSFTIYSKKPVSDPVTGKTRYVFDGNRGTVTPDGTFTRTSRRNPETVRMYEYGFSLAVHGATQKARASSRHQFHDVKTGDTVYVMAVLKYIYGTYSQELLESSHLSLRYPGISCPGKLTKDQKTGIERISFMVADLMSRAYGNRAGTLRPVLLSVCIGTGHDRPYVSQPSAVAASFLEEYGMDWRDLSWMKQ